MLAGVFWRFLFDFYGRVASGSRCLVETRKPSGSRSRQAFWIPVRNLLALHGTLGRYGTLAGY